MFRIFVCLAAATAIGSAGGQPTAPPVGPTSPPDVIAPSAAALKVGAIVTDRTGARLGPIQSLTEAARGPMVVIEIDGKLVSVPQSTLMLKGKDTGSSSQTKAEIIAAAPAPP